MSSKNPSSSALSPISDGHKLSSSSLLKTQDPPQDQVQKITTLYSNGELEKALTSSKELLKIYPNSAVSHNLCGAILARLQKYDDAIKTLNSTMPKSFKAQIAEIKGDVYLAKGDKAQAKTQYQTAIDVSDKDNAGLLQIKLEDLATTQSVAE